MLAGALVLTLWALIVPQLTPVNACVAYLCLYVCGIGDFLAKEHAFKRNVDTGPVAIVVALVGGIETGFRAFAAEIVRLHTDL